ncbi:hypothetical protein [Agrobacterium tumefaciens]|uniref:hypothetical protein n=1 Tax=Agrobacterium tumefaciens TaxID=358 RepID=UPI000DCFDB8E
MFVGNLGAVDVILHGACPWFPAVFMFPNLHIIHTYYPTANLALLLFAAALALGTFHNYAPKAVTGFLLFILASNYVYFGIKYYPTISQQSSSYDRDIAVGKSIKKRHYRERAVYRTG